MKNKAIMDEVKGDIKFRVFDTYDKTFYCLDGIYIPSTKSSFVSSSKTITELGINHYIINMNNSAED